MNLLEMLKTLQTKQALIVGFVLAAIYYFVGYNDGSALTAKINQTKQEITTLQTQIAEENRKIEKIEDFKKANLVMGENLKTFITYIPERFNAFDLMKIVSNEAKAANIGISRISEVNVSENAAEKKLFYRPLMVQADLTGNFQQIMLFLSFLTRSDQILTIEDLSLTNYDVGRTHSDAPNLKLNARIAGYRYVKEEPKK